MALPNASDRKFVSSRTRWAIGLAFASGVPIGVFLHASAAPFGPVLVGWLVALVGAVVVSVALGILATDHYVIVGWGYAAGVAAAIVVASVAADGIQGDWSGPLFQFAMIFAILACVSLVGSLPCALVKWEDKKVREGTQPRGR